MHVELGDREVCAMDRPKSDLFDDPTDTVDGELLHDFTLVRRGTTRRR